MNYCKITKLADIVNESVNEYKGMRRYLSTGNLNFDKIVDFDLFEYKEKPSRANQNVSIDDIIVARMKDTVKVKRIDNDLKDIIVSTGYVVLRPKENIYPKYLETILKSNIFQIQKNKLSKGATQKAINNQNLKKIKLPLPPFEIQKKIADTLDKATQLIDKRKEQIEKMDEFLKSLFLDIFGDPVSNPMGWEVKELEKLTNKITDGKHGDCRNDEGSGYYFISAKDIRNGQIEYSEAREILKEDFDEVHRRTNLEIGDVLIVSTGATIGRTGISKDINKNNFSTFQKSVAIIKNKKYILKSEYLKKFLDFNILRILKLSSGSGQKNLLLKDIRRIKIPVPPIDLQNKFSAIVEKTELEKEKLQKSLTQLENNFNSIMQKAFKGELF